MPSAAARSGAAASAVSGPAAAASGAASSSAARSTAARSGAAAAAGSVLDAAAPVRDIAVVATAQTPAHAFYDGPEVHLIMSCVDRLLAATGLSRDGIDFTIAGSCDYLSGMPFAFVTNVDGMGAWPPVYESHVEMDGAWALFEAWLRLQVGDVDTAMVVGSGRSSPTNAREVFHLQADPYSVAPLGLDSDALAGIQARSLIDAGLASEPDFAAVVARSRAAAAANPMAQVSGSVTVADLLAEPYDMAPLRAHDVAPFADGAAAVIIATAERARELTDRPVWIRGIDHRIESHHPGLRDLTDSASVRTAASALGIAGAVVGGSGSDGPAGAGPSDSGPASPGSDAGDADAADLDVAELHVTHAHEEIILRSALGLDDSVEVNPSGGPLCGNPVMATGLVRVIEAADRIATGSVRRAVAHASSGPALQQNLLCLLEGDG